MTSLIIIMASGSWHKHQVKVRGQRVELEEVETALKSCPGIAEAAVLLADDRDEAVLVAFLSHKAPLGISLGWTIGKP